MPMLKGLQDAEVEKAVAGLRKIIEEPADSVGETGIEDIGILRLKGEVDKTAFLPFDKGDKGGTFGATDGGSVVILDGYSSFNVAGVRAGLVIFEGARFLHDKSPAPELHIVNVSVANKSAVYTDFYQKIVGMAPKDSPRNLEEVVGRVRSLIEWRMVEKGIEQMPENSILAFDGSLWAGIKGSEVLIARLVESARSKGIILCGVSKRSALTYKGMPAIPLIQMMGEKFIGSRPWYYELDVEDTKGRLFGKPCIVSLAPKSRFVFKIDFSLPDGVRLGDACSRLASLSDDPGYFGYPYPLAKAHNSVAFSRTEVENLRHLLESRAAESGLDMKKWQLAFQNFHDILDGGR